MTQSSCRSLRLFVCFVVLDFSLFSSFFFIVVLVVGEEGDLVFVLT